MATFGEMTIFWEMANFGQIATSGKTTMVDEMANFGLTIAFGKMANFGNRPPLVKQHLLQNIHPWWPSLAKHQPLMKQSTLSKQPFLEKQQLYETATFVKRLIFGETATSDKRA